MKFKIFGYDITIYKSVSWRDAVIKEINKAIPSDLPNTLDNKIQRIKLARMLSDMFPDEYKYNDAITLTFAKEFVEQYWGLK